MLIVISVHHPRQIKRGLKAGKHEHTPQEGLSFDLCAKFDLEFRK